MSTSSAAHTLLNVLAQSDTSAAASTAAGATSAPNIESDLSTPPVLALTTPRTTRRNKLVQFEEEVKENVTRRPGRSTRGVPPKRLGDVVAVESSTLVQATAKRKPTTQPPQPRPKRVSTGRKALYDAANTLGKTRGPNTAKSITSKLKEKGYKGKKKTIGTRTVQIPVVEKSISPELDIIKYKLRFETRWMNKKVSEDDTRIYDTSTNWIEVMKRMDEPIHTFCATNNITDYMPHRIRAITTSNKSARAIEVSAITLRHADAEPWGRVIELIQHNYSNGYKDNIVVVDSDWTIGGREPPSLKPPAVEELDTATSSQRVKRTQKSIAQSASYQDDRGIFWNEVKAYWVCNDPKHCKVKARHGIACWINKGRHYEISYGLAPKWREAVAKEGGSIPHPPKSIRHLIKANEELGEQREIRKQAESSKTKISMPQASPSVSQLSPLRHKSSSPIPAELDNGEGWAAFWDSIKAAIQSSRPESWQAGLDRAMAALDADFWTLSMLFKATDTALEKVVPQTGLRLLIHQHLSKFISSHRESEADLPRRPNLAVPSPRYGSPIGISSSSSDSDDELNSSDPNELNIDQPEELHDDTSDGMI
ncbi:hypothetical protein E4T44_11889 [Aureobasidium sp. EXF-8845]|nr:hypothetical protein E4T45_11726 [Aureobasidium sp. EXF-8846]KAI4799092.1 hypothetical protein E4T44_11889 [Aureobasidium sp. EXF-8845]